MRVLFTRVCATGRLPFLRHLIEFYHPEDETVLQFASCFITERFSTGASITHAILADGIQGTYIIETYRIPERNAKRESRYRY